MTIALVVIVKAAQTYDFPDFVLLIKKFAEAASTCGTSRKHLLAVKEQLN